MKSPISNPVLLFLALTGLAAADIPRKAPISRYTSLWTNSPFTAKPPPDQGGPVANPLDDYALIGISPIGKIGTTEGYRVTLINKKKPEDRIIVDSGNAKSEFKILGVTRKDGDPLGTVVRMQSGSMTGTVSFDEKLLTLVTVAPKTPVQQPGQPVQIGQPGQLPTGIPGQPVQPGQPNAQRQPRPRVVPPPTPQPGAQVQPGQQQVAPQNNLQNQRPQRRGNGN
ncbi:MAG: hypothetical protein V4584_13165 [Verrucomicrobiota bacterium]